MRQVISDLSNMVHQLKSEKSRNELVRIIVREMKLDYPLASISYDDEDIKPTEYEIVLARNGKKIKAVKSLKDRTGLTLIEAKHLIESVM